MVVYFFRIYCLYLSVYFDRLGIPVRNCEALHLCTVWTYFHLPRRLRMLFGRMAWLQQLMT